MIPDKTPTLAAIAWITVVLAYAWASNRDYEDAVLASRSGQWTVDSGEKNPSSLTTRHSPLATIPATRHSSLPTIPTGDRK